MTKNINSFFNQLAIKAVLYNPGTTFFNDGSFLHFAGIFISYIVFSQSRNRNGDVSYIGINTEPLLYQSLMIHWPGVRFTRGTNKIK